MAGSELGDGATATAAKGDERAHRVPETWHGQGHGTGAGVAALSLGPPWLGMAVVVGKGSGSATARTRALPHAKQATGTTRHWWEGVPYHPLFHVSRYVPAQRVRGILRVYGTGVG